MPDITLPETTLGKVLAALGVTIGLVCTVIVAYYVVQIIANWRVFSKAGEPGWKSVIPIYNRYIIFKIAWKPVFFWITLLLSFASSFCYNYALIDDDSLFMSISAVLLLAVMVLSFIVIYKLSRAFGHGLPFTLGLLFLNPIFVLILGFGRSEYKRQN